MASERHRLSSSSVSVGQVVGHYRVMSQLGAGGMGEVWEAEDSKLDRRVALKVLPADLADSPERLERFEREAKALAALGRSEEAIRLGIKTTALVPLSSDPYFGQGQIQELAWIYILAGEYDLALDQLEILLAMPSWITIPYLKLDPPWAPLRDLPRFKEFEHKYG